MLRPTSWRAYTALNISLTLLFIIGCKNETTSIESVNATRWINIQAAQYSPGYFFIDTIYRQYWEQLHASVIPIATDDIIQHTIIQLDVWESATDSSGNGGPLVERKAYIGLPAHPIDVPYQPGFADRLDTTSPGNYQEGDWNRLDPSVDYRYDAFGGYFYVNNFSDDNAYAVSYIIYGPDSSGKQLSQVYGDTVLGGQGYLKLIKPKNIMLHAEYKPAWDLLLKNVYNIGRLGYYDSVSVNIGRFTDHAETFQLFGYSLLEILGLDRFDISNLPRPDGRFDFIPGLTVNLERGDIIFPTLRPFDKGIVEFFQHADPHLVIPDSFLFPAVYDTTRTAASNISIQNNYTISVGISIAGGDH